jgi:hypothetical protein
MVGLSGSYRWLGGVLAPNGKIYGMPFNIASVLIIDPMVGTTDTTSMVGLSGSDKWMGGMLAPNGKIYAMPCNIALVLIIDPTVVLDHKLGNHR